LQLILPFRCSSCRARHATVPNSEIYIEVGLDTQYLLARMRTPTQTLEAETFEQSKQRSRGVHFLSVQSGPEAEQPDGFWLLRDVEILMRSNRRAADLP
jgi:hypothetical protein